MRLNLTGDVPLSGSHAKLLENISAANRKNYALFINSISEEYSKSIDWWVTPFACRNTYTSETFLNVCKLKLVQSLLENSQKIEEIAVGSKGMQEAINELVSADSAVKIFIKKSLTDRMACYLKPLRNFIATIYHVTSQFIWANIYRNKNPVFSNLDTILIDTFLYEDSVSSDGFQDRHYPEIGKYLQGEEKARIKYLPTFYKIRDYKKIIKAVRTLSGDYLLKEDYLRINDYLYALTHPFRSRKFVKRTYQYQGIDITSLVQEDFFKSSCMFSSVEALLKYRVSQRMAETGLKISCYINWYENQEIDHGLNAGMRKYYPEARSIGYQGYHAAKNYLCIFPIEQEYKSKVIPEEIAVIGSAIIGDPKEFCKEVHVSIAPALRQKYINDDTHKVKRNDKYTVLVALPAVRRDYLRMIKILKEIYNDVESSNILRKNNIRILLKPHPTITTNIYNEIGKETGYLGVKLVAGDFNQQLDSSNLFISTASGTCLEALSRGIPTIIIGSVHGLTYNPVSVDLLPEISRLCFTGKEVFSAIIDLKDCFENNKNQYIDYGLKIRKEYFEPVTRESVINFLGLS